MKKGLKKYFAVTAMILTASSLFTGCGFSYSVSSGSHSDNGSFSIFGGGTNVLKKSDAKELKVEKSVVDPITNIQIHTSIAQVELIEADNYYVEIDYLYWEDEPEYTLEDGKLFFDDSDAFPNSYSINFNLDNTIKIYLPKDSDLDRILIENSSGDVDLAGFVTDNLKVTVSYGDLTIKNAGAAESDITLSAGKSKISDFQVGELDFTNSYGNAVFTNINTGEPLLPLNENEQSLNITLSSGDVDIEGLKTDTIDVSNSYGDINCTDIIANDFEMDLSSGDLDVSKADLKDIDINNSYGNVTLSLFGPDTDYSLDLSTSYGKVKVGNKDYDQNVIIDNDGSRKVTADLSSGDVRVKFE